MHKKFHSGSHSNQIELILSADYYVNVISYYYTEIKNNICKNDKNLNSPLLQSDNSLLNIAVVAV